MIEADGVVARLVRACAVGLRVAALAAITNWVVVAAAAVGLRRQKWSRRGPRVRWLAAVRGGRGAVTARAVHPGGEVRTVREADLVVTLDAPAAASHRGGEHGDERERREACAAHRGTSGVQRRRSMMRVSASTNGVRATDAVAPRRSVFSTS